MELKSIVCIHHEIIRVCVRGYACVYACVCVCACACVRVCVHVCNDILKFAFPIHFICQGQNLPLLISHMFNIKKQEIKSDE